MSEWQDFKKKGNSFYELWHFEEALEQYEKAIDIIEQEQESNPSLKTDLAKLYSNKSAARMKLADVKTADKSVIEEALSDGRKALELDPSFHKAHLRCGSALVHLERFDEAVTCVSKLLAVYKTSGKNYTEDKCLLLLMARCQYFTHVKHLSPNWDKVKFKDNCKVIDPLGAGDFKDLSSALSPRKQKVSYLVRPGCYTITSEMVIHPGGEVDVVGDGSEAEEVVFTASGSIFSREACSIFAAMGGSLSLTNVTLNQTSDHPERHAVFSNHNAKLELEGVKGYSKCSGCLGILNSDITMRRCEFIEACGGVILCNSTKAVVESCKFTNCTNIGVELRDGASATVVDTEVTGCGSQGVVCHAEAKGFSLKRCKLVNNCRTLRTEPAVSVAGGRVSVCDTELIDNKGGGIMAHNGGRVTVERCHISGGRYGVGLSLKGSAVVRECHLEQLTFGVMLVLNVKGKVRLENNTMKDVLREVQLTPDDEVPVMVGTQHTVEIDSSESIVGSNLNKRGKKDAKKLTAKLNSLRWGDGEKKRVCTPCGMSQTTLGVKFKQCSACRTAWYCSQECQRKDWPLHKQECKKLKELCGME